MYQWKGIIMSELRTLFKRVDYDLAGLLHYIDIGDIGLPDIQRPFVWSAAKVRDLFDSMYRGFPIGYLLFWANADVSGVKQIGIGDKAHKVPSLLIVDGQQRLTSLYAVFRGKTVFDKEFKETRIEIAFRPRDGKFEVADAAIRRDPEFVPSVSDLWSSGHSSRKIVNDFLHALASKRPLSDDEEEKISHNLDRLFDLQKFPFTALEISPTVTEEQVADIFVRINSEGVQLNQADFILTLMSVFWDDGRAELETFCRLAKAPSASGASPFNYFIKPDPDQLLRVAVGLGFRRARLQHVYSILRGKDLDTGEFSAERRVAQFEMLKAAQSYALNLQNWHDFLKAVQFAGYRHGGVITSQVGLLYTYALYLIGRRDFGVEPFELRRVIARWFFMSQLTGRYTNSPETAMDQDLARLRNIKTREEFIALLDQIVASTLTEDLWNIRLPDGLATAAPRSPSLFAYIAALNKLDAKVLYSEMKVADLLDPATKAYRSAIERHHLFPKAYLRSINIPDQRDTNQIANYALVEWTDNEGISAQNPAEYVPKYEARYAGNPRDLSQMYYWHALPEDWQHMEYHDFLAARRRLMADVIRHGFARLGE